MRARLAWVHGRALWGAVAAALLTVVACGGSSASSSASGGSGASAGTITLGSPGIPPVISGLLPYVADKQGFYKKYGVDVKIRNFETGTDAVRALNTKQIDVAIAPPALLLTLDSKGSQLVGIQGQEVPDWLVGSIDPNVRTCAQLKGQGVGVDAVGGIRYTALAQMLRSCGLTINDVHPVVAPGANSVQGMVAGQLKISVLHLDEQIEVDQQRHHPITVVMRQADVDPGTMYEMYGVRKDVLAARRQAFVRMVAAQIAALRYMFDPANLSTVAQLGTVTGESKATMMAALQQYYKMGFWTLNGPGMPEANVNKMIKSQVAVGNIKQGTEPTYAQVVDNSVYQDALKLVNKTG
jgi:NitT/TauT family transport system substrate-binding protein